MLTLKSAWTDGTRQLLFEPLTLLGKLAALIPRPRINLVVYHGVLAPHCGWRARVGAYGGRRRRRACASWRPTRRGQGRVTGPWAALMRRAFDLDVLACPRCGAHWQESRWGSRCCTCSSGVKDQVPREVYEAQVALMEMSLDREVVLGGLKEARKAGVSPSV